MVSISGNAQRAVEYLKTIKPRDGWAVEANSGRGSVVTYRLLRRTIPLTDNSFLDIHFDPESKTVVGILAPPVKNKCQGQILVNAQGLPVSRGQKTITIGNYKPLLVATSAMPKPNNGSASDTNISARDPNQQNELTKLALGAILVLFGMKLIASIFFGSMFMFYVIALPAIYFYAKHTCPNPRSFDAKKELKRVLRGHHLPNTHPDKPRGMLEEWTARISATLTTELATFPGYEVQQYNVGDAVIGVKVIVPTANMEAYWVGAFEKWHYVYSRQLPRN